MGLLQNIYRSNQTQVERMPTALCISEDKGFLNNVRVNLSKSGFIVIITSNATEALVLTEENHLDVIICDYELSQIDGISLFEKILETKGDPHTPPTLIVTEKYAAPLLTRCVTAGAAGLQSKNEPIEIIIERTISLLEDTSIRNELEINSPKRAMEGGIDILTRIASKKHFTRRFSAESVASYRDQNAISLLFMTIDRPPVLEERHGKTAIEGMLAYAAKIIEGELRSRDCVGRYSEYMFSIVLPETNSDAARSVADRLRRILQATEFGNLDHPINISVSVGASTRPAGVRSSPSEMITQALRSCVAAQELGGNRVIADKKLSGQPVALILGSDNASTTKMKDALKSLNIETRLCSTIEDAKETMAAVPTKMLMLVPSAEDATSGLEFLAWTRNRYPKTLRLLVSSKIDPTMLTLAINKASIDYYLPDQWVTTELSTIVEEIVYM